MHNYRQHSLYFHHFSFYYPFQLFYRLYQILITHRVICERYPNTAFTFNTILLTTCHKTNKYIMTLSRLLRTALVNIPNANIFDAHSIMYDYGREFNHKSVYVERHGVGIHLIRDAVIHIRNRLAAFLRGLPDQRTCGIAASVVR